jgi:hypothetical protein
MFYRGAPTLLACDSQGLLDQDYSLILQINYVYLVSHKATDGSSGGCNGINDFCNSYVKGSACLKPWYGNRVAALTNTLTFFIFWPSALLLHNAFLLLVEYLRIFVLHLIQGVFAL